MPMAKKTLVVLSCDLCGADASESATLNGYEMDLCDKHYKPLKEYVGVGIRTKAIRGSKTPSRPVKGLSDIRAWGQANGYKLGDRGRIPQEVMDAYQKAHEA